MSVKNEYCRSYPFYMVTLQRLHIFFTIVCVTLWALPPPTLPPPVPPLTHLTK